MAAVVAVGGVDPSGAAGVAAIAGTARGLGVYALLIPTCIVVEDTSGVRGIHPVGGGVLRDALEAAFSELRGAVAALSLHPRIEEARATRDVLESMGVLVLYDPVWRASAGGLLVLDEPRRVVETLLPVVDVLVLNLEELEWLAGSFSRSVGGVASAARSLAHRYGVGVVIVKGGHGLDCADVIVEHDGFSVVGEPGCLPRGAHGTGCVYLGALAASAALGASLYTAAYHAWRVARCSVEQGLEGRAARLAWPACLHGYWLELVERDVAKALGVLLENWRLVEPNLPETGTNIVSVAPLASVWAGVSGRLRRGAGGEPVYGRVARRASSHLYRLVISVRAHGAPWVSGAVNIAYGRELVEAAKRAGYLVALYDRRLEPPEVKQREGASIPWGVSQAMKSVEPLVPDVIGHTGDWGKEPMLVFTGSTAVEAVEKLVKTLEML